MMTLSSPTAIVSGTHLCVKTAAPVHSVSIANNRTTGEPRMIYGFNADRYLAADGNETNISERLVYVSRQNGQFYAEDLPIDGNVSFATLAFDRNNKPIVAAREGNYVRIYSREADSGTFKWERDPVGGVDPIQGTIKSVSFSVDSYNEPRVAYSADSGGGAKIYYARKPPFRNLGNRWVIEEPGQGVSGAQGYSSAIAVDSSNRAHLVYGVADKKWFNYWAEPNFFDYRNYPDASYSGADLIMNGSVAR